MLKILALIVFSSIVFINVCEAVEYPLDRSLNIKIKNNTTTVLEFPFLITDKGFDKFKKIKSLEDNDEIIPKIETPDIKKEIKIIDGKQVIVNKSRNEGLSDSSNNSMPTNSKAPIKVTVSSNGNVVELKPNELGTTKIILWGYKHFPIMVNLEVVKSEKNDELTDYYKFLDYKNPKEDVVNFESSRHETVIKKLLKSGYTEQKPSGYDKKIVNEVQSGEGYQLTLKSVLTGRNYGLKSYEFQNLSLEDFPLKEDMFYDEGVYSVSIENLTKKVKSNEKTRVFVVFRYKEPD